MVIILDGKTLANKILNDIKEEISNLENKPCLGAIVVGNDPASHLYIEKKEKACQDVGILFRKITLPENTYEENIISKINEFNNDANVHGFIIQYPLPKHLDTERIAREISPKKDVDCLTPHNIGALAYHNKGIISATPKGILRLLKEYQIQLECKSVAIIGTSSIVGKPLALLMERELATVFLCHDKTQNIGEITKTSDIIISATGQPRLITVDMVKPNSTIVDVGISKDSNGKIVGDVDFDSVREIAGFITPVPGGVGPMTIAMLLENVVEVCEG